MPAFLNGTLGVLLFALGAGIFLSLGWAVDAAAWCRQRLRAVLGEALEVHDWIFAAAFLVVGGFGIFSALMWVGRSNYFWVMTL